MDKGSQIIISADRHPMKLDRVQDRIKLDYQVDQLIYSRFRAQIKIIKKKIEEIEASLKKVSI